MLRNQPGLVGFQWVGGSFMEDVEARESRPPNDIDVVTCHGQMDAAQLQAIVDNQHVNARDFVKQTYHVDHFLFDICHSPEFTVYFTQYWTGLFTHRRDGIWKGLLRVELDTPADDAVAYDHLRAAKANPR